MGSPKEVHFVKGAVWPEHYPPARLPEVAIAGRSNVGKSSLINTLVGRKALARTSQTPGKTQSIHFYAVDNRFLLVDLPGYGYARVPEKMRRQWGPMVENYLSDRPVLCLLVFLLDIRRDPSQQDMQLKEWLDAHGTSVCYVLTKADKIPRGKRPPKVRRVAGKLGVSPECLILFSAPGREGRRELWRRILEAVEGAADKAGNGSVTRAGEPASTV
jgi:GTP-binding protein